MITSLLRLPGLDVVHNLPIVLNQGAELYQWGIVDLKEGKLLGLCEATLESARLPQIVRAGHGFNSTTIPLSARWMLW